MIKPILLTLFLILGIKGALASSEIETIDSPLKCYSLYNQICVVNLCDGGDIKTHIDIADFFITNKIKLKLYGQAYSACTIVIDKLAKYGLACADNYARMFFHEPHYDGLDGQIHYTKMEDSYVYGVFGDIIQKKGGLPIEGWLELDRKDIPLPKC